MKKSTLPWEEVSQIVSGLVISGRLAGSAVNPDTLFPPYNKIISSYKSGITETEELVELLGISPIQISLHQAESINGLGNVADWIKLVEDSCNQYQIAEQLEKISRKMRDGDPIDVARLKSLLRDMDNGKTGTTFIKDITPKETPYILTGWEAIDEHLGGIPEVGLLVAAGNPGVGKTTFATKLAGKFIKKHKDKKVIVYSLEMLKEEITMRITEVWGYKKDPDWLGKQSDKTRESLEDFESRFAVNDLRLGPEEIIADASRFENVGLILVDFADLMIKGEVTESAMANIYRELALGAKDLHCCIVLLSQLNRRYEGGVPRPYHIRYTSMAEALGHGIWMLYNPSISYFSDEAEGDELPVVPRKAYIIPAKMRGGFRVHKEDSPGAIQIGFDGNRGWGNTGRWIQMKKGGY